MEVVLDAPQTMHLDMMAYGDFGHFWSLTAALHLDTVAYGDSGHFWSLTAALLKRLGV
jgi:hypothetical protein